MFYLTTHSTHFIYSYMTSDIWLRTILIVRKETCCCHIGYSYQLTARVLLYAPSHRQNNTYHSLCYTSFGALLEQEIGQWVHDPTTHRTMSERSTSELRPAPSARENLLPPPLHGLLFAISSKGSFIGTILETEQHIPCPLLHQLWSIGWNEKRFSGSSMRIDLTTHRTTSTMSLVVYSHFF